MLAGRKKRSIIILWSKKREREEKSIGKCSVHFGFDLYTRNWYSSRLTSISISLLPSSIERWVASQHWPLEAVSTVVHCSNHRRYTSVSSHLVSRFETNTSTYRPPTSFHRHYRILHNSSAQKTMWLIDVWQRIHNHPRRPKCNVRRTRREESSESYLMSSTNQIHIVSIQELKNGNAGEVMA